jgi:exopolysaccharide biosynthesis polyprenyl glycosylphosphotransferase
VETERHHALTRVVTAFDAVLVITAMPLASWIHALSRHHLHVFRTPPSFEQFAVLPFLTLPLFLGWTVVLGLHDLHRRDWSALQLVGGLLKLHAAVFLSLAVLIFLTQSVVNRSLMAVFLACSFALLLVARVALISWHRYQHERGAGRERLLVVGGASDSLRAYVAEARSMAFAPHVVGRVSPDGADPVGADPGGLTHLGSLSQLQHVLHRETVDRVLFFPPVHIPTDARAALDCCEKLGIPASFAVELPRPTESAPRIETRGSFPFVTFQLAPKSAAALAVKHGADVLAAAAGLVLLAPVLLAIAVAILLTMGRPILFLQERTGLYGRRFRMLKFRTMIPDAERRKASLHARNEMSGPVFKVTRDPRVTRLGALLRRSSLDELPQLVNVLLGQMSLVGPRPLPVSEQNAISGARRRRLAMKPGLTGLWQVSGRSGIDFDEWMRLDLEYVDRWSLSSDLLILLRTIPAVLFARGAR